MDHISLTELKHELLQSKDLIILDFRAFEDFDQAFIPGSIYIGDQLSRYHHYLKMHADQTIYIVSEEGDKSKLILNKLGLEKIRIVADTIDVDSLSKANLLDLIITIEPDELAMDLPFDEKARIIDLRMEESYQAAHIKGAENIPLGEFADIGTIAEIEEHENIYLFSNESDASFAASLIKKQGLHNFRKIKGSMEAISDTKKIKIKKESQKEIIED